MGYSSITPRGNESPIVTFQLRDGAAAKAKLQKANVIVMLRTNPAGDGQMRVSCSIFNNQADVGRLIEALA